VTSVTKKPAVLIAAGVVVVVAVGVGGQILGRTKAPWPPQGPVSITTVPRSSLPPATTVLQVGAQVPMVVGLRLGPAEIAIEHAGFGSVFRIMRNAHPRGLVLTQQPPAGTQLPRLGTVEMVVSGGP
jgi:hypothetical protein